MMAAGGGHVADDVDGGQPGRLRPEVVARNHGAVVCRAALAIRPGIENGNRDGERIERAGHVLAHVVLLLTSPQPACPHANVRAQVALDPGTDLSEHRKLECRVQRFHREATATVCEFPLLAGLPDAAAVCGPTRGSAPTTGWCWDSR